MSVAAGGFIDYWRRTRAELDAAFAHWLPEFFPGLPDVQIAAIAQALDDGKRLRGCLVCLVSDVLGGRRADALPRAVAVECIQSASLIHDDFVDRDATRRGRPAAWTTYGPRRAVLLGDLMFATALQRMVETSAADGTAVATAIATMARGAWQEPLERTDLADLEDLVGVDPEQARRLYPQIIFLKTGALFGTAARLGAISAATSQAMADVAFEFGVELGEAYQIADDLCDLTAGDAGQDPALLLPAVLHFCDGTVQRHAHDTRGMVNGALPVLRARMRAAIERRIVRAQSHAQALAADRPLELLLEQAAPEIVRLMLEAS